METGELGQITMKQQRAIEALLTSDTLAEAARKARVSVRTLLRWQKQEASARCYLAARREVVSQSSAQLTRACAEAVNALREMVATPSTSYARVSAARAILSGALRAVELEELAAKIADIEETLKGLDTVGDEDRFIID